MTEKEEIIYKVAVENGSRVQRGLEQEKNDLRGYRFVPALLADFLTDLYDVLGTDEQPVIGLHTLPERIRHAFVIEQLVREGKLTPSSDIHSSPSPSVQQTVEQMIDEELVTNNWSQWSDKI